MDDSHPSRWYMRLIVAGSIFDLALWTYIADIYKLLDHSLAVTLVIVEVPIGVLISWIVSKIVHESVESAIKFAEEKQRLEEKRAKEEIHLKDLVNIYKAFRNYKPSTPSVSAFGRDYWGSLMIGYNTSAIRERPEFEDAQKHLAIDLPNFLEELLDVEEQVKKLNEDVRQYRTDILPKIRQKMSSIRYPKDTNEPNIIVISDAYTNQFNTIYLDSVAGVLAGTWVGMIIYRYNLRKKEGQKPDLADIISTLEDLHITPDPPPEVIHIDGTHVATLPSELSNEFVRLINSLRKDRVMLNDLMGFAEAKETLEAKASELSKKIGKQVFLIESGKYGTTCEYCKDLVLKSG